MNDSERRGWRRGVTATKAAWRDEWQTERGQERTMRAFAELRADQAYDESALCEACTTLRRESDDPEALCDDHLAAALGADAAWP